jgi:DNA-binding MarR family transcriptional regulator
MPQRYNLFTGIVNRFIVSKVVTPKLTSDHERRGLPPPPRLGALVRLAYEAVRARVVQALHDHGFPDITQTELGVFQSSGPERARPIDLAQRCHMTKQAMNYVLAQMEERGYLERRSDGDSDTRLVYLTPRGSKVLHIVRSTIDELEVEWRAKIGQQRFDQFLHVMDEIIQEETRLQGQAASTAVLPMRRRGPQKSVRRTARRT